MATWSHLGAKPSGFLGSGFPPPKKKASNFFWFPFFGNPPRRFIPRLLPRRFRSDGSARWIARSRQELFLDTTYCTPRWRFPPQSVACDWLREITRQGWEIGGGPRRGSSCFCSRSFCFLKRQFQVLDAWVFADLPQYPFFFVLVWYPL